MRGERVGRIRCIKPEFPQSESIGALTRDARLLFIQLWTLVDDEGRTRGNSRMLASLLYPYDADAGKLMEGWLKELEDSDHIRRYVVDSHTYLEVLNWLNHQKIDRPSISKLPPFDESSRVLAKVSVGREGKGRDQGGGSARGVCFARLDSDTRLGRLVGCSEKEESCKHPSCSPIGSC